MKKSNLSLLLVVSILTLESVLAADTLSARTEEKVLTNNKIALEDPYFQLKSMKVRELTDEEALQFENEEVVNEISSLPLKLKTKNFTGIVPGGIPNIPPMPPQASNMPDGGLTTATGPGGNVSEPSGGGVMGGIIAIVDKLVAIGAKIIPTIDKGRAVVTNNPMTAVSVLPRIDAKDPVVHDMGNWSIPVNKHYRITYSNGFGSEVISFVYSISFQHSGTYGGKGRYLAGIRMSARDINVTWGFDLDATSQLIQISNVGTAQNVIAGATVEIIYTVKNWTRTISTAKSFHVTGTGKIYQLD